MRIAIFTETFLPKIDGVVTRLLGTLEQLRDLGHEVLVFAPGHPPRTYAGFRIVRAPSLAFKPWYPELRVGLAGIGLTRELTRFQPDIIHAVNPVWLAAWGTLAAVRRNIALLSSFHTDVPEYTQRLGLEWITDTTTRWVRYMHNRAQINLCTSAPMVERAHNAGIRNVHLWPRAVDTNTYSPQNYSQAMRARLTNGHPEDKLLLYVGRLSKEKDLHVIRQALSRLGPGVRLAFVGAGPHARALHTEFAHTNTVFTGYMSGPELATAYASADVFVFPSTTETLGLVALESIASGVPVVGARAGGIPFAVEQGVSGLLFTPGDSADLASQISILLDNDAYRTTMSKTGRTYVEQFGWRAATEELVHSYERALSSHGYAAADLLSRLRA